MYQKGSITVYLSLTLAILVSLIGTALYSVQCAGAQSTGGARDRSGSVFPVCPI